MMGGPTLRIGGRCLGAPRGGRASAVQSTQQRDLAALALVVGLFVVLFVVTLFVGPVGR
jgi:hypothetical protein